MSEADWDARVRSGEVWEQFCDSLKRAGQQILRPEAPDDAFDRAEGFRYLTRLLRTALEAHVEFADRDFPVFFVPSHETVKIGADNPDNRYARAELSGRHTYRIRGKRGTVHYLSFGTQSGGYDANGKLEPTGFLDAADMDIAPDGSFEILVSRERQPGNWLPMTEDTRVVIVRQTFHDRSREVPAELSIERLDRAARPTPFSATKLGEGLACTTRFVEGTARLFADWAASYAGHVNQLPPADQALCQSVGGDANIFYYHSQWRLEPDEALIIDVARIPECDTWNVQIDNYWMESLDYRYHRICINEHGARRNPDGSVTLVLAHRDPGHPNWLETASHRLGTMCFRWVRAKEHVHPTTRVVELAQWKREHA